MTDDGPRRLSSETCGSDPTGSPETERVRAVARAYFVNPFDLRRPEAAVDTLENLADFPDTAVQVWVAGALGRLAAAHPEAIPAGILGDRLDHDDAAVQHNAVEALAALVVQRPESVAPAAGDLRALLDHDDPAVQHNAAGVLGRLAAERPDAVVPAVDDLRDLLAHDDEAVRRMATSALVRLGRERPEVLADGDPGPQ